MGIAEIIGLVLLATTVLLVLLAWRRVRLVRQGGIDVAVRLRLDTQGRGWHLGVARYQGDELAWFRASSLRAGADQVLERDEIQITERREPGLAESYSVPPGSVVLRCRVAGHELELAMSADTLTGFLSWLESAPPGRANRRAS